jgi:hypothetical protein
VIARAGSTLRIVSRAGKVLVMAVATLAIGWGCICVVMTVR